MENQKCKVSIVLNDFGVTEVSVETANISNDQYSHVEIESNSGGVKVKIDIERKTKKNKWLKSISIASALMFSLVGFLADTSTIVTYFSG